MTSGDERAPRKGKEDVKNADVGKRQSVTEIDRGSEVELLYRGWRG